MPAFSYTARDRQRRTLSGTVQARDRVDAIHMIERDAGVPIHIEELPVSGDPAGPTTGVRRRAAAGRRWAMGALVFFAAALAVPEIVRRAAPDPAAALSGMEAVARRIPAVFLRIARTPGAEASGTRGDDARAPVAPATGAVAAASASGSVPVKAAEVAVSHVDLPAEPIAADADAPPVKTFRPKHQAPKRESAPERTLVEKVAAQLAADATTDSQKAAAIYYWISRHISYDVEAYATGRFGDQSPEAVVSKGKAVCGGYATLFVALARAMGLEARMVTGRAIGILGMNDRRASVFVAHAWNVAQIDGSWSLFDVTWGAKDAPLAQRALSGRQEYYFQTPPGRMIYDHFPDESRWQLLGKPMTWEECLRLPRLKPPFFLLGLEMSAPDTAVLEVAKSDTVILSARETVEILAELTRDGGGKVDDGVEVSRRGTECRIKVRPPAAGLYLLTVWGRTARLGGGFENALELVVERRQ